MGQSLFFYGTLCHLPLLRTVLGHALDPLEIHVATLGDYTAFWALGHAFPILAGEGGGETHGLLVCGLSEEDIARLDFYEGGFAYELRAVTVQTGTAQQATRVYFPASGTWQRGAPWVLADWQEKWAPTLVLAAQEFMQYYGRVSAQDMAARYPMICARAAARNAAVVGKPTDLRSATPAESVQVVRETPSHCGFFRLDTLDIRHPLFAGGSSALLRREVFVTSDAAMVLPYDARRDRVLLIEQFRMGPFGRGDPHPWQLEPVAGRVDAGETPVDAARREAQEETGLVLERLEHIGSYYPSPGSATDYFHSYIGLCDLPDTVAAHGGLQSEAEDIKTHLLSFAAAMDLLTSGEADNGPLILSLLWLQRERPRLRASA